jgi:hypothetical protein
VINYQQEEEDEEGTTRTMCGDEKVVLKRRSMEGADVV